MSNTPAGWYPQNDGRQRYWDGQQWTEHFAPGATEQMPQTAAQTSAVAPVTTAARPWFRKKRVLIPAGLVGAVILGSALTSGGDQVKPQDAALKSSPTVSAEPAPVTSASPAAEVASPSATPTAKPAAPKPAPKPAAPTLTTAQENAKGSAESYLDMSGFSRKGLIEQLKFEDYATKDIEAALATMKVNWNEEAAQSAESYMEMSHFSRGSLIDQLKFEGYTSKQAAYGAKSVGL
ncbi:Ltp family lipoprotein [Phycicoccus avicenniae]|uniref:Ltp family lipoprotein n=1 Tax=Phycicoccus avicenniae TaxID=2828860 RepID=UPI003D26DA11